MFSFYLQQLQVFVTFVQDESWLFSQGVSVSQQCVTFQESVCVCVCIQRVTDGQGHRVAAPRLSVLPLSSSLMFRLLC